MEGKEEVGKKWNRERRREEVDGRKQKREGRMEKVRGKM